MFTLSLEYNRLFDVYKILQKSINKQDTSEEKQQAEIKEYNTQLQAINTHIKNGPLKSLKNMVVKQKAKCVLTTAKAKRKKNQQHDDGVIILKKENLVFAQMPCSSLSINNESTLGNIIHGENLEDGEYLLYPCIKGIITKTELMSIIKKKSYNAITLRMIMPILKLSKVEDINIIDYNKYILDIPHKHVIKSPTRSILKIKIETEQPFMYDNVNIDNIIMRNDPYHVFCLYTFPDYDTKQLDDVRACIIEHFEKDQLCIKYDSEIKTIQIVDESVKDQPIHDIPLFVLVDILNWFIFRQYVLKASYSLTINDNHNYD